MLKTNKPRKGTIMSASKEQPKFNSVSRRDFLKFMGLGAIELAAITQFGCSSKNTKQTALTGIAPSSKDDLLVAKGLKYDILLKWGDEFSTPNKLNFGFNNDFISILPINNNSAYMMVNHEYPIPTILSDYSGQDQTKKSKEQFETEQKAVGVSVFKINKSNSGWVVDKNDSNAFRVDGTTKIPFAAGKTILGASYAIGTFANCAGGQTPWGTFLTCEENYDDYYGDIAYADRNDRKISYTDESYGWHALNQLPPEHYGWVVEVNPKTGKAKKHTALGRFFHECALVKKTKDGTSVVYMGDDSKNEFIYKFISDKKDSLESGTLYVANTKEGKWLPLDINQDPRLKEAFKDQTELLVYTRQAGRIVGATPQNRPEDIEINPHNGDVIISCTNNSKVGDNHGHILRISETNGDPKSLTFKSDRLITGGEKTGFSCPDNLAFDAKGNLWICTDISGSSIGKAPYTKFKNNGLFYVPMSGPQAGEVIQLASAPAQSELTGLCFSPDNKVLYVSVQHPGEFSKSRQELTSHWPEGGQSIPKSSVVGISGPLLDSLLS